MAYKIKLGTFSKLENSTAQPTVLTWAEYDVNLKEGADYSNPVLTMNIAYSTVKDYNYAYFWDRYYWVTDKKMLRTDLVQLTLKVDVLATYKSTIGSSSQYVLRSASEGNGNIVDHSYPTTTISYGHAEDDAYVPGVTDYSNGCYIVNVLGTATTGNTTLWKLSPTEFRTFISSLYAAIDGFQFSDIKDAIIKLLGGSPETLVSSAMWLPPFNFSTGTAEEIYVGGWDSGVQGSLITDPIFHYTYNTLTIPRHPQASSRGTYLNLAPYSTYILTIPLFGTVTIDSTAIKNSTTISVDFDVDAITGQAHCLVTCDGSPSPILADLSAQMGVAAPLRGQSSGASIAGGIVSTAASAIGAIATGGAALPLIGAAASGVGTAIEAMSGISCSLGSSGGALSQTYKLELNSIHLNVADADTTHHGRALYTNKTISTLSGFVMCAEGDVAISGPLPEQQEVKRFLEAGFFYE